MLIENDRHLLPVLEKNVITQSNTIGKNVLSCIMLSYANDYIEDIWLPLYTTLVISLGYKSSQTWQIFT